MLFRSGNRYSRQHVKLNPDEDDQFWNFSIDELNKYDLKTMFEKIMKITKYQKIIYIGHSMGGGSMLAAGSRDPDYFSKHIKSYIGIAPSTRSKYSNDFLKIINDVQLLDTLEVLNMQEIFNYPKFPHNILAEVCEGIPSLCGFLLKILCDKNPDYDNAKRYSVFLDH